MRTLLVVPQTEYRQDGREIPREAWLHDLWTSHTGKRLVEMLPRGCQVEVVNASPWLAPWSAPASRLNQLRYSPAASRPFHLGT